MEHDLFLSVALEFQPFTVINRGNLKQGQESGVGFCTGGAGREPAEGYQKDTKCDGVLHPHCYSDKTVA